MLLKREPMDIGTQQAEFNGQHLTSGIYYYRITVEGLEVGESPATPYTEINRMLLVN